MRSSNLYPLLPLSVLLFGCPVEPGESVRDEQQMFAITEEGPVEVPDARSVLQREQDGIHVDVRTWLEPGHAYTLWWVIFNRPEACIGECDQADLFLDPEDESQGFNVAQVRAAEISALWAGGAVATPTGRWTLSASLAEGELPGRPGQLLIGAEGSGAIAPIGAVSGLTDAMGAEIHVVIQDHGPAFADPILRTQQLTTFQGACNPVPANPQTGDPGSCAEVQFAIHK